MKFELVVFIGSLFCFNGVIAKDVFCTVLTVYWMRALLASLGVSSNDNDTLNYFG